MTVNDNWSHEDENYRDDHLFYNRPKFFLNNKKYFNEWEN